MKFSHLIISFCFIALFASSMQAQPTLDQRAQAITNQMASVLDLDANQKAKVLALYKEKFNERKTKSRAAKGKVNATAKDQHQKKYQGKLKGILGPEKYKQWEADPRFNRTR